MQIVLQKLIYPEVFLNSKIISVFPHENLGKYEREYGDMQII